MSVPTVPPVTGPLDMPGFRKVVDTLLEAFLESKAATAADGCLPGEVTELLSAFVLSGGKRLRPLLCILDWHAAHGQGTPDPVIRAAASLELFHAFALIHDDVMDRSATRRGHPTVHRTPATRHAQGRSRTDAGHLGTGAAVLIGDVALVRSGELLHTAGLSHRQLTAVQPLVHDMSTEVMYGQFLDLLTTGRPTNDVDASLTVIRYKTATYTVERPLQIGAALAGADEKTLAACTAFALPLGDAFPLRDDLLGAFGSAGATGKSPLDDFRDGKPTALLALALAHQRATAGQRADLHALVGNPALTGEETARIRGILTATGARDEAEQMIRSRREEALHVLAEAPFPDSARAELRRLAHTTTTRNA